jgi:ABC-type transporter Mla subunit MlaD
VAKTNEALNHIDSTLVENRPDLRDAIVKMRETLTLASSVTDQLDRSLNYNTENIDEMLENLRHITDNLKEFTDTIKARPYTLIRSSGPPARAPGGSPKP